MKQTDIDRFWSKVDKTSHPHGCWTWTSLQHPFGYGRIGIDKKKFLTHRFSYILHYGPITSSQCVLHKCDNPKCVNPAHLFLGNRKDNAVDRDNKNRTTKGMNVSTAILTDKIVYDIKYSQLSIKELIKKYNLSYQHIWAIKNNKLWKHI